MTLPQWWVNVLWASAIRPSAIALAVGFFFENDHNCGIFIKGN